MSLVALVSAKRSPGVTTAAVALASVWPVRPALVIECDPAGGDLAADAGLPLEPGLTSLAASRRHGFTGRPPRRPFPATPVRGQRRDGAPVAGRRRVALGRPVRPSRRGAGRPARHRVFADCGRLDLQSPRRPSSTAADLVVVVVRPTLAGVEHAAARHRPTPEQGQARRLLLVGEQPYPAKEVGAFSPRGHRGAGRRPGRGRHPPARDGHAPPGAIAAAAQRPLHRRPARRRLQAAPHGQRRDAAALAPMNGNGAHPAGDRR